jgi:DNA-binding CsgD family transcriptional regulator
MPRKSPYVLQLTATERNELECLARQYTSPYYKVMRAKMILSAAQGLSNDQIAAGLSVPRQIVSKWRKRFFEERLAGLDDQPRSGRPPVFSPRSGRASQSPGL